MGARAVLGFCIFAHPWLTATLGGKTGLIVEVEVETLKGQLPCLGLVYPSINGINIVLSLYYNSAVLVKPVVGGESPKRFLSAATQVICRNRSSSTLRSCCGPRFASASQTLLWS